MKSLKNLIKKEKTQLIILFIFLVILTSEFYYMDVNSNIRQGMNFWKALFQGDFFNYYSINLQSVEEGLMVHNANYDMFMNFLMGVWELPLYIIEAVKGINVQDYLVARIYAKLIYPIAIMLAQDVLRITVREILEGVKKKSEYSEITQQRANNAAFMFAGSALVLSSSCVITQADIFGIIFMILALRYICRQDFWRFFLFFVIAAQCKNFALFIFIPIIMLLEKNLFKLAGILATPLVISSVIEMPFKLADPAGNAPKHSRVANMIYTLLEQKINVFGVDIPILFVTFGVLCIFAYMMKAPSLKENRLNAIRWIVYFGFLANAAFFFPIYMVPYWVIYFLPFITLLFVLRPCEEGDKLTFESQTFKSLFVEVFATCSLIFGFMINFHYCYDVDEMKNMLVPAIFSGIKAHTGSGYTLMSFSEMMNRDIYANGWALTYAVFVVYCIYLIVSEMPSRKEVTEQQLIKNVEPSIVGISYRSWLWIRFAVGFILCNISVGLWFLS